LALIDYWPLGQAPLVDWRRSLRQFAPMLLVCLGFSVATMRLQRSYITTIEAFPLDLRIANALTAYASYIGKTFVPIHLAVIYPHPGTLGRVIPVGQWLGAGSLIGLITFVAFRKRREMPGLMVGWLWFTITLLPIIGLVQVGEQRMADRYTYLPAIG